MDLFLEQLIYSRVSLRSFYSHLPEGRPNALGVIFAGRRSVVDSTYESCRPKETLESRECREGRMMMARLNRTGSE